MKIISWNVNGLRAVEKKGELGNLIRTWAPDILLLQEIKANHLQLEPLNSKYPDYLQFYNPAEKPGYSGTGIWVSNAYRDRITYSAGISDIPDDEGRISSVEIDGDFIVFGLYFPNGGKSEEAWRGKLTFYDAFLRNMNALRKMGKKIIWAGDVNCAHEPIDLARPRENEHSIGFLPEERAWVSRVIDNGWIDVFRYRNPDTVVYSWWHVISRARDRNIGWRIDYFICDEMLIKKVYNSEYLTEQMGSDHCPVLLEIDYGS